MKLLFAEKKVFGHRLSVSIHRVLILGLAVILLVITPQLLSAQERLVQPDILAKLVHPEVADRLSLTDAQRAKFQSLLLERIENLRSAANDQDRAAVVEKYSQLALAEMTEAQKEKLEADQPTQNLMFQFREMKWDQVLAWFASQQDLTLVMDRIPPGSFTYSDTRSYSPAEAIDLLNSILITRGFTLVRREKMLMVAELNDAIPVELLPRVPLEELPERGRFELVSVVFPLDGRPVDAVVNEIKPYLNSFGKVLPLARGTQILVIENAGKMQTINELVASVPVPKAPAQPSPAPGPLFAAYSVGNLEPAKTLEIIRKLIPSENITVDTDTGVLSAFVVPSQQTAIKAALDTMLEKQAALPVMQAMAYQLKGMKDDEFRSQIAGIAPSARIMVTQERALVVASPHDQSLIRQSLVALDIQPIESQLEVRKFDVPASRIADIEKAIQSMTPKSQTVSNAETGTLVVKGTIDDLRIASEMVEMLSRSDDPVTLKIYPLTSTQVRRRTIIGSLPGELADLKLQDSSSGDELLVWGTERQHSLFSDFLKQLDQPEVPPELPVPQIYPLNMEDTAIVLQLLGTEFMDAKFLLNSDETQLTVIADAASQDAIAKRLVEFHERLPVRPELEMKVYQLAGWTAAELQQALQPDIANAKVRLDSLQERLFVWAGDEQHTKLSELISVLAQYPSSEIRTFDVPIGKLAEIEKAIQSMAPKCQLTGNAASGKLIVKGTVDDLRIASEMVEMLSRSDDPVTLKIYPLTPTQVRRRTIIGSLPGELADLKLQDSSTGDELLVWGTERQHLLFSDFLKQLDQPEVPPELPVPQIYPLNMEDTAIVLQLLGTEFMDAKFSLNSDETQLTVIADAASQDAIAKRLVEFHERLPVRAEQILKMYQLAGWTAPALQQALQTELTSERVQLDAEQDRLLVWTAPERHAKIEKLLDMLGEKPPVDQQKVVVVYSLQHASASTAKSILDQLSNTASIVADDKLKKVIITGTIADHSVFQPIVAQLDRAKSADDTPVVQALDVGSLQASQLLPSLQSLFPELNLAVESTANKIIATGDAEELQRLNSAVNGLVESATGKSHSVQTYSVPFGDMSSLPAILSQIVPKAILSSDANSRTITVFATEEQHQRISQALDQINTTSKGNKQAVSYVVRPTTTASVQNALRTLLPSVSLTADVVNGQVLVLASPDEHEAVARIIELLTAGPDADKKTLQVFKLQEKILKSPEFMTMLQKLLPSQIVVEASVPTESLLAIGTPDELLIVSQRVEELVQQWPSRTELTSAVYALEHVSTSTALAILQPLLPGITLAQDPASGTIAATANAEDHEKIKGLIELLDLPAKSNQVAKVYQLKLSVSQSLSSTLSSMMPDARLVVDASSGVLFATATEQQHSTIQALVDAYLASDLPLESRVLALKNGDAATLQNAIQAWNSQIKVAADRATNSLIVTATVEILDQVSAIAEQLDKGPHGDKIVRYYPTGTSYVPTLVSALQASYPTSTLIADSSGGGVFVTATSEDHDRIGNELEQIIVAARASKQPVSYVVRPSQTAVVQTSLRALYPSLSVTTDTTNGQIIVVASPSEQQEVAKIIDLLSRGPDAEEKTLQVFRLKPRVLETPEFLTTLQSLVPPQVTLESSLRTDSLIAVGLPEDLQSVEKRVAELVERWPLPEELTSVVYSLEHAATATAVAILQPLVPRVTLAQDPASRTLAVIGGEEDHRKIRELIQLFDLPPKSNQVPKVYRLRQGVAQTLASALSGIMPDARLFGDASGAALLATATEQQHEIIQSLANEYGGNDRLLETRVFSLRRADAINLQSALQAWNNQVKVTGDRSSNSLIVTGPPDAFQEIADVVAQIDGSHQGEQDTRFYPVENANPNTLARALQENFPKATLAGDSGGGGVFVTATQREHSEIQKLVEQLNAQPGNLPSLKTFVVQHISPSALAGSLIEAYGARTPVRITYSENAQSVFVVGTREELKIAEQLVKMLDVPESIREPRRFQAFSLMSWDGQSVMQALETAFENEPDRVEMQYDSSGGRLVVFGTAQQLAKVTELMESLAPLPRTTRVYRLGDLDVFVAREAIDSLFEDTAYNLSPSVTVDHDRQQLLVRATDEQLRQVESLLIQLGVPASTISGNENTHLPRQSSSSSSARVRVIPMPFQSDRALSELQRVWPRIGANPIQVVDPNANSQQEDTSPPDGEASENSGADFDGGSDVSPVEPDELSNLGESREEQELEIQDLEIPSLSPPIVIVVGEKEWTIASDDTVALDRLERLLEVIRSPRLQALVQSGNYSLYLLQRASATEMQTMLLELLRPSETRGPRLSGSMSDLYRRIKIVADNRTNALIVSGSAGDRQLIEELLGVLDSAELMGTLQQLLPTTLTLTSATVTQVYSILREIYRSQLTTNVPRRSMPVPEGVSPEVASLLQQLNAQASTPVLSISTDEVTNSLIVRAPVDLTQEIRQFVEKLDHQTANTPSRRVELIRLESTNTKSIEQALRRLLSK